MSEAGSTKERIAETALALFNERGVDAVSTNHIAAAMGISPGNLYYHFANKEEIVRALFPRVESALAATLDHPEGRPFKPQDLVREYMTGLDMLWRYRFLFGSLVMLTRRDPELAARYRRLHGNAIAGLVALCAKLVEDGHMAAPEEELEAIALNKLIIWFNWVRFVELTHDAREISRAQMVEGAIQCFLAFEPYLKARFARPVRAGLEALLDEERAEAA